jgi:acetylornithine deacetylase/succinyl-diaminopimelate desuccinylase-like protein
MWLTVPGVQGHVAYPHRTDNPVPKPRKVVAALDALHLDDGTDAFQPSQPRVHRGVDAHPGDQHRARFRERLSSTSVSTISIAARTW